MKKILSISVIIIAVLAITFCIPTNVYASDFVDINYGWSTRPVTVYADMTFNSNEISQIQQAINAWNSTRFGTFFVYGGTMNRFSILSLPGICGITKDAFPNGSNTIASTIITGNGTTITKFVTPHNSNISFNNTSGSQYYLKSVVMHELGHGLGLDHSIFSNSFMYQYANGVTTFLQSDLEMIDRLY